MDRNRTIGYLLKGFGRTSETFISTEMALLEEAGVRLHVFSFLRLEGQAAHGVHQRIRAEVTYLPEVITPSREGGGGLVAWWRLNGPRFAAIQRAVFRRHPWRYVQTLLAALRLGLGGLRRGEGRAAMQTSLKEFLQACAIAEAILDRGVDGPIRHLHAHFAHTATTVAMHAASLTGLPFSFTAHAKDIYRVDMNPGDLLLRKMVAARFTVTCTEANRSYLIGLGGDPAKIHRIYHGVDLTLFRESPGEADQGPGVTRAEAPPLVLSVGRFVEKKGFPDLVEAMRLLWEAGVDCRALIVGGLTPHTETVRAQIEAAGLDEIVTLQHAVPQEELRTIYQRASLFVLPCVITDDGDRDGIPNVLVEALAMGIPVLSTRISGIPELIEDGVTGRLVAPGDPAALAQAIEDLLQNPAERHRLAQAGRERVDDLFDASRNVRALQRLLDDHETQR